MQEGFEPTAPVFERAKTVHALGYKAIVIGRFFVIIIIIIIIIIITALQPFVGPWPLFLVS
jgi:hypothetical protein